jgi:hypothetical protein
MIRKIPPAQILTARTGSFMQHSMALIDPPGIGKDVSLFYKLQRLFMIQCDWVHYKSPLTPPASDSPKDGNKNLPAINKIITSKMIYTVLL